MPPTDDREAWERLRQRVEDLTHWRNGEDAEAADVLTERFNLRASDKKKIGECKFHWKNTARVEAIKEATDYLFGLGVRG